MARFRANRRRTATIVTSNTDASLARLKSSSIPKPFPPALLLCGRSVTILVVRERVEVGEGIKAAVGEENTVSTMVALG